MRLLLDEHYSKAVAAELRKRGHDVVLVAGEADLRGASDITLFAWAQEHRRAIVTQDVRDFVAIAREAEISELDHYGIVFTSPRTFPPAAAGIGRLVTALSALLDERPAEDALRSQIYWLQPAGR